MSGRPYTSLETQRKCIYFLCQETGLMFDVLNHGNIRKEVKGHNLVGMFFLWRRTVQCSAEVFNLGPNHWRQYSRLLQQI